MSTEATGNEFDQAVRRVAAWTVKHMTETTRPLDHGDFTWYRAQLIGVQRLLALMSDPRESFIGEAIESLYQIQRQPAAAQSDALRELCNRLAFPEVMA
jgi:hypothetical protein